MKINNNYSSRFFGELLNNTTDYSSSAYNRQGQARPMPGARNFIWISIMGSRNQSTWAIIDCFPEVLAGGSISTSAEQIDLNYILQDGIQVVSHVAA